MWKDLEDRAREALGDAGQRVRDVEVSEAEASNMRMQADIAERFAPVCHTHPQHVLLFCAGLLKYFKAEVPWGPIRRSGVSNTDSSHTLER